MLDQVNVQEDVRRVVDQAINRYDLTQIPTEFAAFLQLIRDLNPRTIVEIGTYTGASIWAIGQVVGSDTLLITIDMVDTKLMKGPFREAVQIPTRVWRLPRPVLGLEFDFEGTTYHRVIGDSHQLETRHLVESLMLTHGRAAVDVLFIDGDHDEAGVRADFELYAPLVREGGLVGFHDITDNDWMRGKNIFVGPFWEQVKQRPGWESAELKDRSDTLYAHNPARIQMGIGILTKLPDAAVEEAKSPPQRWQAYRMGHSLTMRLHYTIHWIGGRVKQLLGR